RYDTRAALGDEAARSAQRRPLKPIMFCTTASLASATSPCSRTSSAHDSHSFLVLPATFTVTSSSASSPQDLQVGMIGVSARAYTSLGPRVEGLGRVVGKGARRAQARAGTWPRSKQADSEQGP